jgi:hypothetical protein
MSEQAKHTPGPWEWFTKVNGDGTRSKEFDGQSVKFLLGSDGQGFAHTVGLNEPQDTANANLIAAAPDLLSAITTILIQVIQGPVLERDACINQARAAIAKAQAR